jgi:hypothetical protein
MTGTRRTSGRELCLEHLQLFPPTAVSGSGAADHFMISVAANQQQDPVGF